MADNSNMSKMAQIFSAYHKKSLRQLNDSKKYPGESLVQYNKPVESDLASIRKKQSIPIPSIQSKPLIDDLLNSLIIPRDWEQDGKRFIQTVATLPPSRDDITNLQKQLDERLVARQARESGLCPIRDELFSQCFNEIIRQVTIDCMERGIILSRVRDDLYKTIQSYKGLYNGSIPFGEQKQLIAERGIDEYEESVKQLQEQKKQLEIKRQELQNKREAIKVLSDEKKIQNEQRRKAEIDYLKYQGSHLESFLKQTNK
ncbi:hypothetical protein pb186bvf_014851 [Paramecium bursaria]